jgi:hypothetical protein
MHLYFYFRTFVSQSKYETCMVNSCETEMEEGDSELFNDTNLKSFRNSEKKSHVEKTAGRFFRLLHISGDGSLVLPTDCLSP